MPTEIYIDASNLGKLNSGRGRCRECGKHCCKCEAKHFDQFSSEASEKLWIGFIGKLKGQDGSTMPFSIAVEKPNIDAENTHITRLHIPQLGENPVRLVHGHEDGLVQAVIANLESWLESQGKQLISIDDQPLDPAEAIRRALSET